MRFTDPYGLFATDSDKHYDSLCDMGSSDVYHYNSLNIYQTFFINKYADNLSHELLTDHYN